MRYRINVLAQCVLYLICFLCVNLNASEQRWIAVGYLSDTLLTLDKTTDFPVYRLLFKDGFMCVPALNGKLVKIDGRFHKKNSTTVSGKLNIDTIYVDSIRLASSENNLIGYDRFPGCIFPPVKYSLSINEYGMANCQVYDHLGSQMLTGEDTFNVDLFKINSLLRVINENNMHEMPDGGLHLSICWSAKVIAIGHSLKVQEDGSELVAFESVVKHFEQYILSRCFPVRIAVGTLEKSNDNKGLVLCGNNLWDAYQFTWTTKYDSLIGKRVQIRGRIKQDDLRCLSCPQQLIVVDTIFEINSTDKPLISYTTLGGVIDITEVDIYADGRIVRSTCVIDEKALSLNLLNRSISAFVMNGYSELDSIYDFNLGRYHPVYYDFSFQSKDVVSYGLRLHPALSSILQEMKAINDLVKIEKPEINVFKKLNATPNPFNPKTKICFSLNKKMRIKLAVYDLKGRLVTIIKDEICETGSHQVMFKASHLPGGVYLLRLDGEGLRLTQKITLLR